MLRARDMFKKDIKEGKFNSPDLGQDQLADYSKTMQQIPPTKVPVKPGQVVCVACGKVIDFDQDLSEDLQRRQYQIKNRLHNTCDEAKELALDMATGEDPERHKKVAAVAKKLKAPVKIDTVKF